MSTSPTLRLRVLRCGLVGLLAAALLAGALTSTAAAKRQSLYWGAEIGPQMTGERAPWDMRPVQRFERIAGKGLSLISFSAPWVECGSGGCEFSKFPTTPLENARRYGAIPVFGWTSSASPPAVNQPQFRLARIIDGSYDAYIREFAVKAREWGHPFFLRFDWEMNGFWFPWSEVVNGNRPGQYVAAWRHVHRIFDRVGADNVTWVWCPNIDLEGRLTPLRRLYPGNRYVDWTAIDGFNWGERRGSPGWLSFDRVFRSTYDRIAHRIAPRKPLMIAETASSSRGGSKVAWIRHMLVTIRHNFPRARALVWYDVHDRGTGWPIETSKRASRAFRRGIAAAAFRPNVFGGISSSPIRPPRR